MNYFITFLLVMLVPIALGWWIGWQSRPRTVSKSLLLGAVMGVGALWFAATWWIRSYADTDKPGWPLAEWYAHAGKWWTLLAGVMLGYGIALGAKKIPPSRWRRFSYYLVLLCVVGLVGRRTMPVYLFLKPDAGRRDANGYMLQSLDHEYTCAGVALLNYLERHRDVTNLTERVVTEACGTTMEGSTTIMLLRAARSFGLTNATARVLDWNELAGLQRPAIVYISTLPGLRHATLLVKVGPEELHFIDPSYGPWKAKHDYFQRAWFGKTVLLD